MSRRAKRRPAVGPRPNPERDLLIAVNKLTGLDAGRVSTARAAVRALKIAHATRELLQPTIDAAVGATLLVDSLDVLATRGVPRTKLESKLRKDPDVWPTWAELRAARNLAEFLEDEGELQLEAGRERGSQADFRFSRPAGDVFRFVPSSGSSGISIEFKAIGLSDEEAAFRRRARSTIDALRPPRGFVTLHAPLHLDREGVWMNEEARAHGVREAVRLVPGLPPHTTGLSGAVVVGRGAEESYVRRVRSRLREAFEQLPQTDECWVAFHWSNGAPLDAARSALETLDLPTNLAGILFVGSAVAFPHAEIHNFSSWAVADYEPTGARAIHSSVDERLAKTVLDRSSAHPACVLARFARGSARRPPTSSSAMARGGFFRSSSSLTPTQVRTRTRRSQFHRDAEDAYDESRPDTRAS